MAGVLPRFLVLKSGVTGLCARYREDDIGLVRCDEKNVTSPYAKIEVEPSQQHKDYFHLRFCYSNRYFAMVPENSVDDPGHGYVVARSKQPIDDPCDETSTLFAAKVIKGNVVGLRLATSDFSLRVLNASSYPDSDKCIYTGSYFFGTGYFFTFVDWESLVLLPKYVAFKGDNENFLKLHQQESHPYLKFSSGDGNQKEAVFEVIPMADGHVRIKSDSNGKFWRLSPAWIWADSSDETDQNKDTLFWPEKVDDKTVALRCVSNRQFCKRLTTEGKDNCLNACVSNITNEAKLVVEELVLKRSIYDIRYRMEDARVFDEEPQTVDTFTVVNEDSKPFNAAAKSGFDEANSYTFSKSLAFKAGFKVTVSGELPKLFKAGVEISFEVTGTLQWGGSQTKTKRREITGTVTVPPKSKARVACIGTRGKCSIPFSYSQKDKMSTDGHYVTSQHIDGVFEGVSNYNYNFSVLETEPL